MTKGVVRYGFLIKTASRAIRTLSRAIFKDLCFAIRVILYLFLFFPLIFKK